MRVSIKVIKDFLNTLNIRLNGIILVNVYISILIILKNMGYYKRSHWKSSSHTFPSRLILNDIEITEKKKIAVTNSLVSKKTILWDTQFYS